MRHLVFCTYELHPVNRGGCGVVVDALARKLAGPELKVTVLADMPQAELDTWHGLALKSGVPAASLGVRRLETLAPFATQGGIFESKSLQFARGLRALYAAEPFHAVEFHEYAGPAYASLLKRASDGWFAPAKILVRIHGGLELIDRQEEVREATADRLAMYLMERYTLRAADQVLSPSSSIGREYASLYDLDPARSDACPPPMDLLLPDWPTVSAAPAATDLLVFGKLQEVKGSDLVAQAAVSLFKAEPTLRGKVVFVGSDTPCQRHARPTSECVKAAIPAELASRFEFRSHLPREELPALAATMRAGIIASRFESFCLAAHELRRLGLPLVISTRAAFRDYFSSETAFLFDGSLPSLRTAMHDALRDDAKVARLRALPRLAYPDVGATYAAALARPATEDPRAAAPLALLAHEIELVRRLAASAPVAALPDPVDAFVDHVRGKARSALRRVKPSPD